MLNIKKYTSLILQKANEEKWNFPKNAIEAKDIFSARSDTLSYPVKPVGLIKILLVEYDDHMVTH